mmetsp:Transcript_111109/g.313472  ORF Transcript_111109/g.313472 Transcript_111109/m.313472 type:complete len:387 (-) Transcript_111109:790-1950(-)
MRRKGGGFRPKSYHNVGVTTPETHCKRSLPSAPKSSIGHVPPGPFTSAAKTHKSWTNATGTTPSLRYDGCRVNHARRNAAGVGRSPVARRSNKRMYRCNWALTSEEHCPAACRRSSQDLHREKTPSSMARISANGRCATRPSPETDAGNQKRAPAAAPRSALLASFSSECETGITRFHLSSRITCAMRRITATSAAFSKSVICTSGLRNSTRQPMSPTQGGGLKRTFPQFVPWICSQWSASSVSSMFKRSSKTMSASRQRRWATCRLSRGSTPPWMSSSNAGPSIGSSTSLTRSLARLAPMNKSQAEVREFLTAPSSASRRSSQLCLKASQRVSVSATRPRKKGVAALKARSSGARTKNWSVRYLASSKFGARNVACMQHWQAPKA